MARDLTQGVRSVGKSSKVASGRSSSHNVLPNAPETIELCSSLFLHESDFCT
jgi:hypothetical protein